MQSTEVPGTLSERPLPVSIEASHIQASEKQSLLQKIAGSQENLHRSQSPDLDDEYILFHEEYIQNEDKGDIITLGRLLSPAPERDSLEKSSDNNSGASSSPASCAIGAHELNSGRDDVAEDLDEEPQTGNPYKRRAANASDLSIPITKIALIHPPATRKILIIGLKRAILNKHTPTAMEPRLRTSSIPSTIQQRIHAEDSEKKKGICHKKLNIELNKAQARSCWMSEHCPLAEFVGNNVPGEDSMCGMCVARKDAGEDSCCFYFTNMSDIKVVFSS